MFKNDHLVDGQAKFLVAIGADPHDGVVVGAAFHRVLFVGHGRSVQGRNNGGTGWDDTKGHVWSGRYNDIIIIQKLSEGYAIVFVTKAISYVVGTMTVCCACGKSCMVTVHPNNSS